MSWSAITDGELTAGQLVLASTWKKLVDNPEAVTAGDASVPLAKRILIDAQTCPLSAQNNDILFGDTTFAEFYPSILTINQVLPFYAWEVPGVVNWLVPWSGWYEITVQGGGGGGASANSGSDAYAFASPGGSIRVHKLLTAGETLVLTVGAGGAIATNGGASSVVGASFSLGCSGGPGRASNNGSVPLSVTTFAINTTVVSDQPLQLSQMGMTSFEPFVSSAVVGWGGSSQRAGHAGIVIIERISNNGV